MSDTPQSGADLLARIKPQLRRVRTQICLRPDLLDEHTRADTALADAINRGKAGARLGTGVPAEAQQLAERVQQLEAEIEAASPWFEIEALPKDEFTVLCERFPPRKGNELDAYAGFNRDLVMEAAVRKGLVDPVFDDESWDELISKLNPSEWKELIDAANEANGGSKLPKSRLAQAVLTSRADTSKPPESGE